MVIDTRKQAKVFQGCFGSCSPEECSHIGCLKIDDWTEGVDYMPGDIVVTNRGIEKVIQTSDLLK